MHLHLHIMVDVGFVTVSFTVYHLFRRFEPQLMVVLTLSTHTWYDVCMYILYVCLLKNAWKCTYFHRLYMLHMIVIMIIYTYRHIDLPLFLLVNYRCPCSFGDISQLWPLADTNVRVMSFIDRVSEFVWRWHCCKWKKKFGKCFMYSMDMYGMFRSEM